MGTRTTVVSSNHCYANMSIELLNNGMVRNLNLT